MPPPLSDAIVAGETIGNRLGSRLAQGVGLRLAPSLGHGLSEVGEEHGEPQPERDLELEREPTGRR